MCLAEPKEPGVRTCAPGFPFSGPPRSALESRHRGAYSRRQATNRPGEGSILPGNGSLLKINRLVPNFSGPALLHYAFCAAIPYIITTMNNGKSLLKSNKYLRNGAVREAMIVRHASSSARIEGVKLAIERAKRLARASRAPR